MANNAVPRRCDRPGQTAVRRTIQNNYTKQTQKKTENSTNRLVTTETNDTTAVIRTWYNSRFHENTNKNKTEIREGATTQRHHIRGSRSSLRYEHIIYTSILRFTIHGIISIAVIFRQLPSSQVVVGNLQEEIQKATLPIIHYGLDLWTCKVSGRKYLGTHVFYVDSKFVLRHALIAVSGILKYCQYFESPGMSFVFLQSRSPKFTSCGSCFLGVPLDSSYGSPSVYQRALLQIFCIDENKLKLKSALNHPPPTTAMREMNTGTVHPTTI